MVRIRLRRAGAKGQPTHRIVAADREKPRDGRFLEILGDYNPRTEPATVRVKEDRIYHWLSVGAQPTDAVLRIFNWIGLLERYERYKKGEDLDVLLAESKEVQEKRNVDPRTRRDVVAEKAEEPKAEKPSKKEKTAKKKTKKAPVEEVQETPEEEVSEEAPAEEVEETPEEEVSEEAPAEEVEETPEEDSKE